MCKQQHLLSVMCLMCQFAASARREEGEIVAILLFHKGCTRHCWYIEHGAEEKEFVYLSFLLSLWREILKNDVMAKPGGMQFHSRHTVPFTQVVSRCYHSSPCAFLTSVYFLPPIFLSGMILLELQERYSTSVHLEVGEASLAMHLSTYLVCRLLIVTCVS